MMDDLKTILIVLVSMALLFVVGPILLFIYLFIVLPMDGVWEEFIQPMLRKRKEKSNEA